MSERTLWITGGGCYGRHYARQLLPALGRGPWAGATLRVMDRNPECAAAAEPVSIESGDWDETLDRLLTSEEGARGNWLVPAPLTPHLFARWLARSLATLGEVHTVEPPLLPDTPFARVTAGRLVFSFAEWRCPTHCVEPAICPATRQPKSWDLGRELASYALRLREAGLGPLAGPFVARLAPIARGVSGFPLSDWTRAARRVRALLLGPRRRSHAYVLAATASRHGAASLLRVETKKAPASAGAKSSPASERV